MTDLKPPAGSGLSAWAPGYDLLLCDVWGVVHDGVAAFPAAADALTRFRAGGGTVVLLTNAPRPRAEIARMLDRMGLPRAAWDAIVSSGDVTVDAIVARGDAPVHHMGPPRDLPLFEAAQARMGRSPPRVAIEAADYVVCSGMYDDSDDPDSYGPALDAMARRGTPMICANPDIVVHAGDALIWCAGALAERYARRGGPATLIGKPHPLIYAAARAEAERLRGAVALSRTLAIGDGMFTDILGARRLGCDSLLVTSGVHRDAIRRARPDGGWTVEPAAYAALAQEAGATPTGHVHALVW